MFKRQQDFGISLKTTEPCCTSPPSSLAGLERGESQEEREQKLREQKLWEQKREQCSALEDLERLMKLKTEQVKKYGHPILPESDFSRRHRMVRSFLYLQNQKSRFTRKDRCEMARMVAASYNKRDDVAKKIVRWEKMWIQDRVIPESKAGKCKACLSLLGDEGVLCAVRDFVKTQGDGKCGNILINSESSISNRM
jgi:hypothetical protein